MALCLGFQQSSPQGVLAGWPLGGMLASDHSLREFILHLFLCDPLPCSLFFIVTLGPEAGKMMGSEAAGCLFFSGCCSGGSISGRGLAAQWAMGNGSMEPHTALLAGSEGTRGYESTVLTPTGWSNGDGDGPKHRELKILDVAVFLK